MLRFNHHYWRILLPCLALVSCARLSGSDIAPEQRRLWEYKHQHTNLYSLRDEVKLGEIVFKKQIEAAEREKIKVDPPEHAALKRRIDRIVQKLAAASDRPDLPYEVKIFDRPKIANAYCLPGGKIGVFTGLFDPKKGLVDPASDDEIAAVLAHEIAHATMRHVTRRISSLQAWGFLGSLAGMALGQGVGGNAQAIFNNVFSVGTNLYLPTYSRKFEKEADQIGFFYMARAGYRPDAAVRIWRKAAEQKDKAQKTSFLASHPASGERARQLEGWLPDAHLVQKGSYP